MAWKDFLKFERGRLTISFRDGLGEEASISVEDSDGSGSPRDRTSSCISSSNQ